MTSQSIKKDTTQQTLVTMGLVSSFSINEPVFRSTSVARPTGAAPLKIKMESIGVPPAHDDDWDQCPARTRIIWPNKLVPWWQPTHPTDKPPYTFATLVAFAILVSPDGRLLLNDIYRWISHTYPHFIVNKGSWQNSVRHNLSLNKQWFLKVDRRPTQANPGKGSYWTLVPGAEQDFINTITHPHSDLTTLGTCTTMKITRPEDYNPQTKIITKPYLGPIYTTFKMTPVNPKRKRIEPTLNNTKKRRLEEEEEDKKNDKDEEDDDKNNARWECDSGVSGFDNDDKLKTMVTAPVEYNVLDHFLEQLPLAYDLDSILGSLDDYSSQGFFFTDDPLPPLTDAPLLSCFDPLLMDPTTTTTTTTTTTNTNTNTTITTTITIPPLPKDDEGPLVIHLNGDDMADQYLTFDDDDTESMTKKLLDPTYI